MTFDHVNLQTHRVMPGVTLSVLPTDKFKVGMLSLSFVLPFSGEEDTARALMLSVLKRGCQTYPTMSAINRRLDELYATPFGVMNRYRGDRHYLGFAAETLENRYVLDDTDIVREVLLLMRELLFFPLMDDRGQFAEQYVASEKKNTIDQIRSLKNSPRSYAMARFRDLFYCEEPDYVGLLQGAEERVEAVRADQLTDIWRHMVNTAPIHCFYVGGLSVEQLKKCLCDILMPVMAETAREANELLHHCRASRSFGEVRRVEEQGEQGQSHLIMGFRSGITIQSPEYYAMMLCNELLGCSPISRLFVHVREEQSLCYACSSSYREQRGDVIVGCGIRAENKERAERAILSQIEALQNGDFTEAEWQAAKKSLIGSTRQVEDSARVLSDFYSLRQPLCPDHTISGYVSRFDALTKQDVMAAAKRLTLEMVYFRRGTDGDEEAGEEDTYDG